jgi:F-type H+-transporting ATPase subunit gamma
MAGRRGESFYRRRGAEIAHSHPGALNKPDFVLAGEIATEASDLFFASEADEVHILYSTFINVVTQKPTLAKLLPFSPEDLLTEQDTAEVGGSGEYLVEPSPGEVMIELLPRNLSVQVLSALLETACSEEAARMTAMDTATSNCKEMIENLTLVFNKARQAAITAELMDIVGGAEALNQ